MMKKALCALCAALLLVPLAAAAENYSFPYAGVRLQAQSDWTVLLKDSLDSQRDWIERMGADIETLRADYAANNVVFEAFMRGGEQVSLSVAETEETALWQGFERMTQAAIDAFINRYTHAPYTDVRWAKEAAGTLSYRWTMEAKGVEVPFARLTTIRQGALYTLTATGVGIGMEALEAANLAVFSALEFLGSRAAMPAGSGEPLTFTLPESIADDGIVTPVRLTNYSGVTYDDQTSIALETLPGTELMLQTQNDTLRAIANADGGQSFVLSTRRESTYVYTLTASAPGRSESRMSIPVERKLSPEAQEDTYRRGAMSVNARAYEQIASSLASYRDKAISIRGRVEAFAEVNGFPCALVYTSNPGTGEWRDPLWVIFTRPLDIEAGEMLTVYGDVRGDTLPSNTNGGAVDVPVIIGRFLSK